MHFPMYVSFTIAAYMCVFLPVAWLCHFRYFRSFHLHIFRPIFSLSHECFYYFLLTFFFRFINAHNIQYHICVIVLLSARFGDYSHRNPLHRARINVLSAFSCSASNRFTFSLFIPLIAHTQHTHTIFAMANMAKTKHIIAERL